MRSIGRQIRFAAAGAVLGVAALPGLVSAGPPISFVMTMSCDDGKSYDINFGPPKNAGTALHVVDSNQILTSNYFLWTIDGQVIIDGPRGMQGLEDQEVVWCTSAFELDGHLWEYTIAGWITPRT